MWDSLICVLIFGRMVVVEVVVVMDSERIGSVVFMIISVKFVS